jgi:hypothetical protein
MPAKVIANIASAKIFWRNFSGEASDMNKEGDRNFCVGLPEDIWTEMKAAGWPCKMKPPRNDDDVPLFYMPVKVKFDFYPPIVELIQGGVSVPLDATTVDLLDTVEIENVDLVLSQYNYFHKPTKKSGITAYLKAIYVTAAQNAFAEKYRNVPRAAR